MAREGAGRSETPRWTATIVLALISAALFAIHLDRPAFFDNEGRYAEVAREMLLRRDWITPEMDFTLFLNKPPLTFWLAAAGYVVVGVNEWARLGVVLTAALTIVCTGRIGARLFGETTGLVAGLLLATMVGFVLEARTLRPDAIVVATVVGAVLCWLAADGAGTGVRTRWLVGMYAILGMGMMAKGLVPLVLAAAPIGLCTLRDRGLAGVWRLRPLLGIAVLGAVILPWHIAVAMRHPGFAWDYVVNQHLLFFLDRKFPRDSEGDTMAFFLSAFVGRAFPWILLLPIAVAGGIRGRRRDAEPVERAAFLCWAWLGSVLLFFGLSPSRLEHYSLPALPAAALLAAYAVTRLARGSAGALAWRWIGGIALVLAVVGVIGVAGGRGLLARTSWLGQEPRLLDFVAPAALAAFAGGVLLLVAAATRRASAVVAGLVALAVPLSVIVVAALVVAEPLFSWKPVGALLRARVPADVDVVFESPEEYQLVGGLVFYADRRITLLEVAGFVPPTYLEPYVERMFLPRAELERRWRSGERLVLVSDPQRHRTSPDEIVPPPRHVLGRFGDRWVLSSVPAAELS